MWNSELFAWHSLKITLFRDIWTSIVDFAVDCKDRFVFNFIEGDRWKWVVEGLGNTLAITAVSLVIGILIGIVVAAIRSSYEKNKETMKIKGGVGYALLSVANGICKVYLTVIRGTPTMVQLLIFYIVIFADWSDGMPVAMISFGINSGAYVAEIFRSGIMSVDEGQFEASRSLGFGYLPTMRYVVVPQAIKAVLPALVNEFIVLLKETSIAGYVACTELTKVSELIRGRTYDAFTSLIAVALIYLSLVMLLTWLLGKLERRLRKNER